MNALRQVQAQVALKANSLHISTLSENASLSSRPINELDELLLCVARDRDKAAFAKLFKMTSSKVKAFVMHCGASNSDAEELVQECMLTAWRKAHTYNPKSGTAITWLYTIVRNKRIDLARKGRRESVQSDDLWSEQGTSLLEDDVCRELEAKYARNLLSALPEVQKQVVFKVYFEGKSHSEIAADLDLPLGTIKSRLRLSMNKLDNIVKSKIHGELSP